MEDKMSQTDLFCPTVSRWEVKPLWTDLNAMKETFTQEHLAHTRSGDKVDKKFAVLMDYKVQNTLMRTSFTGVNFYAVEQQYEDGPRRIVAHELPFDASLVKSQERMTWTNVTSPEGTVSQMRKE